MTTIEAILLVLPNLVDNEGNVHALTIRDAVGGSLGEIEGVMMTHTAELAAAGFEFVDHAHYVKTTYTHPDVQILVSACEEAGLSVLLAQSAVPKFSRLGARGNTILTDSAAGAYQNATALSQRLRAFADMLDQIAKASQHQGLQEIVAAAGRGEADWTDVALRMRELGLT